MLRLRSETLTTDGEAAVSDLSAAEDRATAEGLQDRLRREEQTARALRRYLVEHPPRS